MSALYKTTTADHKGPYSDFDFTPLLPKGKRPGKWSTKVDRLEICERGWHYTTLEHLLNWLQAEIYEIETRGAILGGDDKSAAQQIRLVRKCDWNDRTARLFACDCAEHVQGIWRKFSPNDNRPQTAIDTARKFANGEATAEEMAAAGAAARAAAWAAAGDAARAAAFAAWDAAWLAAGDAAWAAAWAAAGDAAGDATWAAAGDAAGDAERKWQIERLMQYLNGEIE